MLFWLIAACLTLAAALAVLVPLVRAPRRPSDSDRRPRSRRLSRPARRDRARRRRGLIGAAEAKEARAEIGRRILKRAGEATAEPVARRPTRAAAGRHAWRCWRCRWSPGASTACSARRTAGAAARRTAGTSCPADSRLDELVARAEAHLAANPGDGRGWDVLAPIYLRLGRTADAVTRVPQRHPGQWRQRRARERARRGDGDERRGHGLGRGAGRLPAGAGARSATAQGALLSGQRARPGRQDRRAAAAWQAMLADLPAIRPGAARPSRRPSEAVRLAPGMARGGARPGGRRRAQPRCRRRIARR